MSIEQEIKSYGYAGRFLDLIQYAGDEKGLTCYWSKDLKPLIDKAPYYKKGGFIRFKIKNEAKKFYKEYLDAQKKKKELAEEQVETEKRLDIKKQYETEKEKHSAMLLKNVSEEDVQEFKRIHSSELEYFCDNKGNPSELQLTYFLLKKYPYPSFTEWLNNKKI